MKIPSRLLCEALFFIHLILMCLGCWTRIPNISHICAFERLNGIQNFLKNDSVDGTEGIWELRLHLGAWTFHNGTGVSNKTNYDTVFTGIILNKLNFI